MTRGLLVSRDGRIDVERHVQPAQVDGRRQALGFFIGLGDDRKRAYDRAWLLAPEVVPVRRVTSSPPRGLMKWAKANASPSCAANAPL